MANLLKDRKPVRPDYGMDIQQKMPCGKY